MSEAEPVVISPSWEEIWAALAKEPAPFKGPRVLVECPGCLEVTPSYYQEGMPHNTDTVPCELCLASDNVEMLDEQATALKKRSRRSSAQTKRR